MYTLEELIQLKQAGFTAEEIISLSKSGKEAIAPEPAPVETPVAEPKDESQMKEMREMMDTFQTHMNEQMEAFKESIKLSNINHDSFDGVKQPTVDDVVASIIRPNGPRKETI